MQQVQMVPGAGPEPKMKVYYEGTDTIYNGYCLCSNTDYTASALTIGQLSVAAITAASACRERWTRVEKPAAGNLHRFAGVAVGLGEAGRAGPCVLDVAWPSGAMADVYTDANCTIDATVLYLQSGSYAAGTKGSHQIGLAAQTIDRSSTNGKVLAYLGTFGYTKPNTIFAARARTAVQLPTAAIWNNFPIAAMRENPGLGSLLCTDFTGNLPWFNSFVDATYAATAAGKTPTEHLYPGVTAIGELLMFTTTDNQAVELQFPCPIVVSGGNPWAFGVRIKQSVLTNTKAGYFAGLMLGQKLTGNLIVDAGTLQTEGSLGFQVKEGDGDKIDLVYDETGQTQNEHDDDYVTQVADAYNVLELYCNGTTIQGYLDGVLTGTAISAVDIAAADFPTAKIFVPTLAMKGAAADDFTVTADWIMAAQLG